MILKNHFETAPFLLDYKLRNRFHNVAKEIKRKSIRSAQKITIKIVK